MKSEKELLDDIKKGDRSALHQLYSRYVGYAMEMRNEDGINLPKMNAGAPELYLCALTTIYHKSLSSQFNNLRSRIMFKGGQCTATP
jgi:hypothetical protein